MGKLVLVTGGARSGKSNFAESIALGEGSPVLYIATAVTFDDEMKLRIKMHRARRSKEWETIEAYKDIQGIIKNNCKNFSTVLLDCITIMITNLMMDSCACWDNIAAKQYSSIEKNVQDEIEKLIRTVKSEPILFIAVTNEVGCGLVPEYPFARCFRDIAGRINQQLAKASDEVYLCVCGIPVRIK